MLDLTEKQRSVVQLLARAAKRRDPSPTFREIAQELNVDVRAAYQHIEALERKGVVYRLGGRRGVQLSPEHAPTPGIPLIGRVAAGMPILAEQNIESYVDLGGELAQDDVFLLKVKGDSMVDSHIHDGDMVLVRPVSHLRTGEVGVVSVSGEATVKEVHIERDRIVLKSHNREMNYPDQIYRRGVDVRIVGKVVLALRFFK